MTTIALADDHHVVRQGLRALLEAEPGFVIAGEATDGHETIDLIERLKPDVLLVDVMMPGLNGLEAIRLIKRRKLSTRIIVLSMYANAAYVQQALQYGADGYVLKDSKADELVKAVREVAAGRRYLCPRLSKAFASYTETAKAGPLDPYETLTTRERAVLQLVAEGNTNADIAARLEISERTVESHRANLMRKLDLHTQADLIRYALKRGIVPLEES